MSTCHIEVTDDLLNAVSCLKFGDFSSWEGVTTPDPCSFTYAKDEVGFPSNIRSFTTLLTRP